jgi:hypothetical protein
VGEFEHTVLLFPADGSKISIHTADFFFEKINYRCCNGDRDFTCSLSPPF